MPIMEKILSHLLTKGVRSDLAFGRSGILITICALLHEQQKKILQKVLPEILKLSVAKNIENKLFSKVTPFAILMRIPFL